MDRRLTLTQALTLYILIFAAERINESHKEKIRKFHRRMSCVQRLWNYIALVQASYRRRREIWLPWRNAFVCIRIRAPKICVRAKHFLNDLDASLQPYTRSVESLHVTLLGVHLRLDDCEGYWGSEGGSLASSPWTIGVEFRARKALRYTADHFRARGRALKMRIGHLATFGRRTLYAKARPSRDDGDYLDKFDFLYSAFSPMDALLKAAFFTANIPIVTDFEPFVPHVTLVQVPSSVAQLQPPRLSPYLWPSIASRMEFGSEEASYIELCSSDGWGGPTSEPDDHFQVIHKESLDCSADYND